MTSHNSELQEDDCPLPNTHGRLEQAHRLWHQALEHYFDPGGFRANLNSVIEALRTVTFMLQGEKALVPDFDRWYAKWQAEMKADPVMKWLSEARTTVIHRAELETQSIAVATVHNNLNLAHLRCEVPPMLSTRKIARVLSSTLPPPLRQQGKDLILSIERQWIAADLPGQELLEALAHAYGVLARVVASAHEQAGREYVVEDRAGEHPLPPTGRLPCMMTTAESRTLRVRLADGCVLSPRAVKVEMDAEGALKAGKRYGIKMDRPSAVQVDDPFTLAEQLLQMAKAMLAKDKYLERVVFLLTPGGMQMMGLRADDRSEKYALMRTVAEQVRQTQATALVDVGEAWTSSVSEMQAGRMPEVARDRGEIIWVSVLTHEGTYRAYETPFSRGLLGRIRIGETRIRNDFPPAYLAPILEVWGVKTTQANRGSENTG